MKNIFTSFFLLFSNLIYSQPQIQFQKCFGGSLSDYPWKVIKNSQQGFTIIGETESSDGQVTGLHGLLLDYWVVNTDSLGNLLWESCFGGSDDEEAYSITNTRDGGSIACGYTYSNDGDVSGNHGTSSTTDAWLIKLDSSGILQWQKCYGGSLWEDAFSITQTFDGGYVFCGGAFSTDGDVPGNNNPTPLPGGETSDVWVVKLDSVGTIQWSKNYGGFGDDIANSIIQTFDSGYAFLGVASSFGGDITGYHDGKDYWFGRLDQSGNLLWGKCYGGSSRDEAYSLKQTPDSGFIMTGRSQSIDGDVSFNHGLGRYDAWILKTDKIGNIEWEKAIGGTEYDQGVDVVVLSDSSYLISVWTLSTDGNIIGNHGSSDNYLANLSQTGQILWSKCYGGSGLDEGTALIEIDTSSWLLIGATTSNDGDVSGSHGHHDYWVAKLTDTPVSVSGLTIYDDLEIYPNPFNNTISLRTSGSLKGNISVINTLGEIVLSQEIKGESFIDMNQYADGIYFLKLEDKKRSITKKIIKLNGSE